jgi:CBS domain-containing protein
VDKVGSLVTGQDLATVSPAATVAEAARIMSARGVGAVPVVDGNRVAGIFTERDVMARVVAADLAASETLVRQVMSTELVVADVGDSREACLERLQRAKVRHLLVLDEGRLAGIISMRDLVAQALEDKDEAIDLLNAYVHYIPVQLSAPKRQP